MRHLMSPLDFTVEELDNLMDLAQDIEKNPNQVHVLDSVMKQQCLISEAVFLVFLLPIPVLQQKGKRLQIRFV